MWKVINFCLILCGIASSLPFTYAQEVNSERYQFEAEKLGTTLYLTLYARDASKAEAAAESCFALVDSLNQILSDYDPSSEIRQLCRDYVVGVPNPVSGPLSDITQKSIWISMQTDGAFDVTIGALSKLWREQLSRQQIPRKRVLRKTGKAVGYQQIALDTSRNELHFKRPQMNLDFGGIGKGYIGDKMGEMLKTQGITSFLLDMGGDLICGDPPPGKDHWSITIPWIDKTMQISNCAVATSGPDYQFFVHKGKRYAHIIDPATGWGVEDIFSTTIIAKTGWMADAFASACAIMPPETSLQILSAHNMHGILGIRGRLYVSDKFDTYIVNE